MTDIALATDSDHPLLLEGERELVDALADRGIGAEPVVWDETDDWTGYDTVIVRSTWDYVEKIEAYREWIRSLEEASIDLWNPPEVLRWNLNKMYLKDLREAGHSIVPSVFLPKGTAVPLERIAGEKNWDDVVIKPLVGAGASDLKRFDAGSFGDEGQKWLEHLSERTGAIVQVFDNSVRETGEWSFVFFNRSFEYAVKKQPPEGDFRVQTDRGGTRDGQTAPESLVDQARHIIDGVTKPFLYARVDGFERKGRFRLLEIEMIEPDLYLEHAEDGAERFAESIEDVLESGAAINYFDHAKVVDEGGNGMNPG